MKKTILTICLIWCAIVMSNAQTTISRDTLIHGDSIIVIETACAPICSSCVRVFNKKGKYKGQLSSPFPHAVFPEAYVENHRIKWRDNTYMMLDEEEKKHD